MNTLWQPLRRVKKLTCAVTIIYCCLTTGCADDGPQDNADSGLAPDAERIDDARLIDGPAEEQDATVIGLEDCEMQIGKPCEGPDDCCTPLSCIKISTGLQICTRGCTRDIASTEMIDEDDCPGMHRCMQDGFIVCLPLCTISADSNPCAEGVACHPASTALTGEADQTVCSHIACSSAVDCPVMLAGSCRAGRDDCAHFSPEAFCHIADGASLGQCALAGVCDVTTGLCLSHDHGDSSASVGDACRDDRDCGGQMRCQRETREADGTVRWRNGYCVIGGCTFASALTERACPTGSSCFVLEPGGHCLKSCDPQNGDACRGQPSDLYGDYECYDWSRYRWSTLLPYSTEPVCDITDRPIYTYFAQPGVGCTALGLQGNPTNMACRDLSTGAIMPLGSDCRCLDTSSSGLL